MPTRDRELMASIREGVWNQRNQAWLGKPTSSPNLFIASHQSEILQNSTGERRAPLEPLKTAVGQVQSSAS